MRAIARRLHIAWCDERLAANAKDNADVKQAATLMGIGPVGASAAVATVGDFKQFRHAAQFGAWIGLTPRQHSSGGKNSLGGITRSDRQRPSSTNPWWPNSSMSTGVQWRTR